MVKADFKNKALKNIKTYNFLACLTFANLYLFQINNIDFNILYFSNPNTIQTLKI